MKRGEIYYIKTTYREEGSEQRADRPAVIVSNDKNNQYSDTVEVVYLTTNPKKDLPTHAFTRSTLTPSTILCEQIFTVAKQRIEACIGELTESEMQAVDAALAISLGIDFGTATETKEIMREPTAEEWEAMREQAKREMLQNVTIKVDQEPEPDLNAKQVADFMLEAIKVQAERDIYRDLYRELLEHVKGGTA